MELKDYLEIFARRKWVIFLTVFFTLAIVIIGVIQAPPKYTAIAELRVLTAKAGSVDFLEFNVEYSERLIGTYVNIATSNPILEELSRHVTPLPKITVEHTPNTEIIQLKVEDIDPALAQYAANKLAQIIITQSAQLYSDQSTPTNIYLVNPAKIPEKPSSTPPWVVIGLGFAIGLMGGIGLALLFESLDTRLYTVRQIEIFTQLRVIGDIPETHDRGPDNSLFTDSRLHTEAFRRLRTNIFSQAENSDLQALLIASPVTQDGRSTVTANLALSIAQANRNVIVIDANLRWPAIHKIFGLKNDLGLSDFLEGNTKLADVIQPTQFPEIHVITSGILPSNPVELLGSDQMKLLIAQLKQQYEVILIDSPASITVTDPAVIAPYVDGVVLVIRQGWVRREALQATLKHLTNVHANLVGVIANRTELGTSSRFSKKSRLVTLSVPASDGSGIKRKISQVEDDVRSLTIKMDTLVDALAKQQPPSIQPEPVQSPSVQQQEQMDHQPEHDASSKLDDLLDSLKK